MGSDVGAESVYGSTSAWRPGRHVQEGRPVLRSWPCGQTPDGALRHSHSLLEGRQACSAQSILCGARRRVASSLLACAEELDTRRRQESGLGRDRAVEVSLVFTIRAIANPAPQLLADGSLNGSVKGATGTRVAGEALRQLYEQVGILPAGCAIADPSTKVHSSAADGHGLPKLPHMEDAAVSRYRPLCSHWPLL